MSDPDSTPRPKDAPPRLRLSADAMHRVANDRMHVTVESVHEGHDAASLNRRVLDELRAAVDVAKQSGRVQVRMGSIGTDAMHDDKYQRTGWRVSGRVIVSGTDTAAVADLGGRLSATLQIASVHFDLTDEARRREEQALTEKAIQAFRARAAHAAMQFGFARYSIHEVALSVAGGGNGYHPGLVMSLEAGAAARGAPEPSAEGGETEVRVTVEGLVDLVDGVDPVDGT